MTRALSVFFLIMFLFVFVITYGTVGPIQGHLFNSDALYLPVLFKDLFQHYGHLKDWYTTPAPYFFPDFIVFGAAYGLTSNVFVEILLHATFQILLTLIALYTLFKTFQFRAPFLAALLLPLLFVVLDLATGRPHSYILNSAFHYGTFWVEIVCLMLFIRTVEKKNRLTLFVGCLLCFLTTPSDKLFLVQFLLPLVVAFYCTQYLYGEKLKKNIFIPLLFLGSGVLGSKLYTFFYSYHAHVDTKIGFQYIPVHLVEIGQILSALYQDLSVFLLFLITFYLGAFSYCVSLLLRRVSPSAQHKQMIFMLFFSVFSAGIVVSLMLILRPPSSDRYLIAFLAWPVIVGCLLGDNVLKRRFYGWLSIIEFILLLELFMLGGVMFFKQHKLYFENYPQEIACIDTAIGSGRHAGLAQYWNAKRVQGLSHRDITIAQYMEGSENKYQDHPWITSKQFFKTGYDFAILSENAVFPYHLSEKIIEQYSGFPEATVHCGEYTVLLYAPGTLRLEAST